MKGNACEPLRLLCSNSQMVCFCLQEQTSYFSPVTEGVLYLLFKKQTKHESMKYPKYQMGGRGDHNLRQ